MYNILLINNTSKYHSGCAEVINFYKKEFRSHNLTIAKTLKLPSKHWLSNYDLVVANGEGTMHDNSEKAYNILNILLLAKIHGCKTMLVNSVWQNNDVRLTEMLLDLDYVSVREVKSKKEILQHISRDIDVHLDLSYFNQISRDTYNRTYDLAVGNRMGPKKNCPRISGINETYPIDIFAQTWEGLIQSLKQSKLLVTGRHHEMYAACKAECPFLVLEGNTHKNSGLLRTARVDIPYLKINASNDEIIDKLNTINYYGYEFKKLFDFMKQQKKPEFLKYVGMV